MGCLVLFRQSAFGRLAGYKDVNDAEPAPQSGDALVGGKAASRGGIVPPDGAAPAYDYAAELE
jgi:hypothetical protein